MPEDKALPKYDDVGKEYVYTWEEDTSGLPKDYELTDTKTTTSSDSQYTYIHTDLEEYICTVYFRTDCQVME